jgi:nucleotide-binding universal stress UspA family protein
MTDTSGGAHYRGQPPIVVGFDGSPSAQDALEWAAAEATAMGRPLHIVHAFTWPMIGSSCGELAVGSADAGFLAAAERLLAEAETRARSLAPTIKITIQLIAAPAVSAMLRQAEDAELVVVGSRGLGGFTGLLLGSVGVALAAHAVCPVVVVHHGRDASRQTSTGPVVVGVDGLASAAAIRFAFHAASRRGVGLIAVRSWVAPMRAHEAAPVPIDRIEESERQLLVQALQGVRRTFPDVHVECKLVHAHPGEALVIESAGAGLVVVGSHGRGGFAGMVLGSVSQAVLQHAACPVAVVRGRTQAHAPHHRIEEW